MTSPSVIRVALNICLQPPACFFRTYKDVELSSAAASKRDKLPKHLSANLDLNADDILPPRVITESTEHIDNSDKNKNESMIQFAMQACIARYVPRSEILLTEDAVKAVNAEWRGLRTARWSSTDTNDMDMQGAWNEEDVMEYDDAVAKANNLGETWHFGRLLELCIEKGSGLPVVYEGRKWKGRVVFQGDQVRAQNYEVAIFSDMASQPATLDASAAADSYCLIEGNDTEVANAVQAYIQARLRGACTTYVHIPYHQWPKKWKEANGGKGMRKPLCPLSLALYGHPQSGAFWEEPADAKLKSGDWETIGAWSSCLCYPRLDCPLVLYVDDFNLSGPKDNLKEA